MKLIHKNNKHSLFGATLSKSRIWIATIVAFSTVLTSVSVLAQEDRADGASTALEEIVTIGTRVKGRTATDSAVPIDIISAADLSKSGFTELGQSLQASAPSFNFSRTQVSDGADLYRPATLRGLQPDQTLVLINGKRRHSQAIFQTANTVGGGAAGTDLNAIPITALKAVEVLRDGAAAQYGSDAIAGVINLQLKDSADETSGFVQWGQTTEGDGDTLTAGLSTGFELGDDGGFLNVSAEYRDFDATNRAQEGWFQGDAGGDFKTIFYNMAVPLGNGELYSFGGYSEREGIGRGFRRAAGSAAQNVPQVFPGGFLPRIGNTADDTSIALGYRTELKSGWNLDTSIVYGENNYEFDSVNTINASIAGEFLQNNPGASDADIAANSGPSEGFSGGRSFDQLTVNIDTNGEVNVGEQLYYVALGVAYRDESANSQAGILASYSCGLSDLGAGAAAIPSVIDPTAGAGCGFQAFSGISPDSVVDVSRSSTAIYVDVETNLTDAWLLGAAVRYEDYDVFGGETAGKISTRFDFSDSFALRGAVSTGFRAPSLQQSSFQAFQTNINDAGVLERSFTASSGSAFPSAVGVQNLEFETSQSLNLGFVWNVNDALNITADAYSVEIDDRIVLGGLVNRSDVLDNTTALAALDQLGVNGISFFSNAINTSTDGVDIIATHASEVFGGNLDITLALNFNETDIDSFNVTAGSSAEVVFPSENRAFYTGGQPQERGTLTFDWGNGTLDALVRINYFGETEVDFFAQNHIGLPGFLSPTGDFQDTSIVESAVLVDLDIAYQINDNIRLSIGANNIFDVLPDELGDDEVLSFISGGFDSGFRFPLRAVPYGFNGASYYMRASFDF